MKAGKHKKASFLSTLLFFAFLFSILITTAYSTFLLAGEYHAGGNETQSGLETLACSQCHTMHGTQGGASLLYEGTSLNPKLLRASSILNLCLYCHGEINPGPIDWAGRTPPQIVNNQLGYMPSAGDFENRNYVNEGNRHSIGMNVSANPPPGYTSTWSDVTNRFSTTFNCLYCHDQHGNTNFRNLRYDPGTPANDSRTNSNRVDITYTYNSSADPDDSATEVNYWGAGADTSPENKFTRTRVRFRRSPIDTDSPKRGIAAFCGKCHVNFYGASGDANMGGVSSPGAVGAGDNLSTPSPWYRHPVSDMDLSTADSNTHADISNWDMVASKTRYIDPSSVFSGDDQPFCLTCHYAHGGGNPNKLTTPVLDHSNIVFFDGSGRINMDSAFNAATGKIRNLCQQCHNQ